MLDKLHLICECDGTGMRRRRRWISGLLVGVATGTNIVTCSMMSVILGKFGTVGSLNRVEVEQSATTLHGKHSVAFEFDVAVAVFEMYYASSIENARA